MKRAIIYSMLILLLAACSADGPEPPHADGDAYKMKFVFIDTPLSRANSAADIQGNKIMLSSYFTDNTGESQIYFSNLHGVTETATSGVYTIDNWYWPLQGKMTFLCWWAQGNDATAAFAEKVLPDGTKVPVVTVNAREALDGYKDFVYGIAEDINCPSDAPVPITCYHGLSWMDIKLYAKVLGPDTELDDTKTTELKNKLHVRKIYIEKVSRKGDAVITPGEQIKWTPVAANIKDQVFYNNTTLSESADGASYNVSFASDINVAKWGNTAVPHGFYFVPEPKTAIVVEYTVANASNVQVAHRMRFDLSANGEWKPGGYYEYKIVFSNFSDTSADAQMIESWTEVLYDPSSNTSLSSDSFGNFTVNESGKLNVIVIDPVHEGGSAAGDDMGYKNGGKVF